MIGPLEGWRVLVTRAEDQAEALSQALGQLGAEVVPVPLLVVESLVTDEEIRAEMDYVAARDGHIALTSRNAARLCLDAVPWVQLWAQCHVWCIGEATQSAVPAVARTNPLPIRQSSTALAELMLQNGVGEGQLVWTPVAEAAEDRLTRKMEEAGCEVRVTVAYRAALPEGAPEMLHGVLGTVNAVTLTSGSAARHLAAALGGYGLPDDVVVACIGPATAAAATAAGLRVDVVAQSAGADALAQALGSHVARRSR